MRRDGANQDYFLLIVLILALLQLFLVLTLLTCAAPASAYSITGPDSDGRYEMWGFLGGVGI